MLAGTAALLVVAAIWAAWDFTVDDAYITFRYSQNLADGHGPVWNRGENPVEGYTNPPWMALMVVPALFGWNLPVAAKLVNLAALVATCWQLHAFVRPRSKGGANIAVITLLLFAPIYLHAAGALETSLYGFLLLQLAISALAPRWPWELPVVTLLAGLTRPEGFAVGAVALAYQLWRTRGRLPGKWLVLGLLLPAAIHLVWRWWFYGWPLPNTFYMKVGDTAQGLMWVKRSLPLLVPVAGLWALRSVWRRDDETWLLPALVIAAGAPYAVSTLMMDYAHRFLTHLWPVLALMIGLAWPAVRGWSARLGRLASLASVTVVAVLGFRALTPHLLMYGATAQQAHIRLAHALAEVDLAADKRTIALGDAGVIPYYSDWRVIDFIGLNDEAIAHGADSTSRVLESEPSVVLVYSRDGAEPRPYQYGFDPERLTDYEMVDAMAWSRTYWLLIYVDSRVPGLRETISTAVSGIGAPPIGATWTRWLDHLASRLP